MKIPLSAPNSLVACWCGAVGGFNATDYTGVPAVWLTVPCLEQTLQSPKAENQKV